MTNHYRVGFRIKGRMHKGRGTNAREALGKMKELHEEGYDAFLYVTMDCKEIKLSYSDIEDLDIGQNVYDELNRMASQKYKALKKFKK